MPRRPTRLTLTPLEDRATPTAGDLDLSFGTRGHSAFADFVADGETVAPSVDLFALQPDGKVVTAGVSAVGVTPAGYANSERVVVGRLTADGRPDPAFDADGVAVTPFTRVSALLTQPDGKLLVAEGNPFGAANASRVLRLTAAGRPDPGFGTDGLVTLNLDGGGITALALRPDGRVLVVGSVGPGHPANAAQPLTGYQAFAAAQLTPDGRPDGGFGTGGVAVLNFPVGELNRAAATAVALQPDGKVVLAGSTSTKVNVYADKGAGIGRRVYNTAFQVARLNPDGTPDLGFGDGGGVRVGFDPSDYQSYTPAAVQVRPDGRIAVAGVTEVTAFGRAGVYAGAAALLTADGRPDPAFGQAGRALTPGGTPDLNSDATGTGVTSFDRFLPDGGFEFHGARAFRLTAAGRPDSAFGPDGFAPPTHVPLGEPVPLPDGGQLGVGPIARPDAPKIYVQGVYRLLGPGPARFAPAIPGAFQVGGAADGSVALVAPAAGGYTPAGGSTVYPGFPGTVRTATADVNGDGVPDLVTGPGPGGGPNVVVTDGKTGAKLADFNAFETTFTGGVFVAAADLNGDGKAEVVVTPDQGGGPVVAIYDGTKLSAGMTGDAAQVGRFLGIDDENFRGGARPAFGDLNGDGTPDLIVAAGFGGGPRVALYDGPSTANPNSWVFAGFTGPHGAGSLFAPPKLVGDFFVFEPTLRNGVFVAAGDLNRDGAAELVFGGGPGGGPRVLALDGKALLAGTQTPVANFFAGDAASRGGVHVAVVPAADGTPRLVTGSGEGEPAEARVYGKDTVLFGNPPDQTLAPFGGATMAEGVFVG